MGDRKLWISFHFVNCLSRVLVLHNALTSQPVACFGINYHNGGFFDGVNEVEIIVMLYYVRIHSLAHILARVYCSFVGNSINIQRIGISIEYKAHQIRAKRTATKGKKNEEEKSKELKEWNKWVLQMTDHHSIQISTRS